MKKPDEDFAWGALYSNHWHLKIMTQSNPAYVTVNTVVMNFANSTQIKL